MTQTLIRFKKLNPSAEAPEAGTEYAAGYDALANNLKLPDFGTDPHHTHGNAWEYSVAPGELIRVGTGLALEIPLDRTIKIEVRSGMAGRGWSVEGGRIDSDYRGEVIVLLRNQGDTAAKINSGDRVAQFLVQERIIAVFLEVVELEPSARGGGGFGSTGI